MMRLHPAWLLCSMLAIGSAPAAPTPPSPPDAQQGACALALQAKQPHQQPAAAGSMAPPDGPPPADVRKKVNPDSLLDPCQLADAERDSDIANNEGESVQEIFDQLNSEVEWNRRYRDNSQDAWQYWLDDDSTGAGAGRRRHGLDEWGGQLASADRFDGERRPLALEPAGAAPAVPEPSPSLMLPGGLAVLWLLAAWRRRVRRQR